MIAVVIPCYRVKAKILAVLKCIGPEVTKIYIVDDCCPDKSGEFAFANSSDQRLTVITHPINLGVGGAVLTGFKRAKADGALIIVKLDGDGQMNPNLIPQFIAPIFAGKADYTKGNRFYDVEGVREMPTIRLIGNAGLSFLTKLSSGYWDIFDPTNGFIAIHSDVLDAIPAEKIAKRFFFESDMLFRLNLIRAVVREIPMASVYGDEVSNLFVSRAIFEFSFRNLRNFAKRIFYNYYLRNFSVASVELIAGSAFLIFGVLFGVTNWYWSATERLQTPTGTVMLAVLPIIIGIQFLLNFLNFDVSSSPKIPLSENYQKPQLQGGRST